MAITIIDKTADGTYRFSGASTDTKGTGSLTTENGVLIKYKPGSTFEYNSGNIDVWTGTQWIQTASGGAVNVFGLPPTARKLTADTYNTTNILGFKILNVGTGDLTLSPASGDTDIVITAAELTLMGINAYVDWVVPELDSITAGTGMVLLVFHR